MHERNMYIRANKDFVNLIIYYSAIPCLYTLCLIYKIRYSTYNYFINEVRVNGVPIKLGLILSINCIRILKCFIESLRVISPNTVNNL